MTIRTPSLPRVADIATAELEKRILEGSLKPGDRLPSERELSLELSVSRPTLREAIHRLVSKGLLKTRHGEGTYVTDRLETQFSDPWVEMINTHPSMHRDLLEFRSIIEAQAARLAGERATNADIDRLHKAFNALQRAYSESNNAQYVGADVAFHMVIAESAHNVLISHLTSSLLKVIQGHIAVNVNNLYARPQRWERIQAQHHAIWLSIRDHDPNGAASHAIEHIAYVQQSLADAAMEEEREKTATRRLVDH